MAKVSNNTAGLVGSAIIKALKPFEARVKTLTYDNGKEFSRYAEIDKALGSTGYFAAANEAPKRTSIACCGNTCPRCAR